MKYHRTPEGRDPQLWQLAQRRASFKGHLTSYIIINLFLWLLWFFSGAGFGSSGLPWPIWPTLGWGIGIGFHYLGAYVTRYQDHVEREYEKLMNQQQNK